MGVGPCGSSDHTHPTPACIHHPPPPAENKNKLFVTNTRSPSRQARARDKFVQQAIEPRKERLRPRLYGIYKQRPATRPRPPVKFVQRNSLPFKPPKHVITIFRDCRKTIYPNPDPLPLPPAPPKFNVGRQRGARLRVRIYPNPQT